METIEGKVPLCREDKE